MPAERNRQVRVMNRQKSDRSKSGKQYEASKIICPHCGYSFRHVQDQTSLAEGNTDLQCVITGNPVILDHDICFRARGAAGAFYCIACKEERLPVLFHLRAGMDIRISGRACSQILYRYHICPSCGSGQILSLKVSRVNLEKWSIPLTPIVF